MFNLPRKANVGDIVNVKGYEGTLYLVTEYTEEVSYDKTGSEECVTYTCINIDSPKEIRIVFDQDIQSIEVSADKSDDFIDNRKTSEPKPKPKAPKPPQLPAVRREEPGLPFDIAKLLQQFDEMKKAEAKPSKQKLTANEQKRAEAKKAIEYLDYLLDSYAMLKSLDAVLGEDETRNEELMMIEEEFLAKSTALYGKHTR